MFGQVFALLEGFVAVVTFEGFLARVHAPVAVHVRRVFEPLLTVGTLKWFFPRRVAAVLHELGGGDKAALAQRALQWLLLAVRVLVALQRGAFLVALPAHVALVRLVEGGAGRLATLVPEQLS